MRTADAAAMSTDHPHEIPSHPALLSRREAMLRVGGGGLLLAGLAGCGGAAATSSAAAETPSCVLTPESTEGPYFLDLRKLRRTITEGRPGLRLDLRVKVVDASTCKPMKGVAVDIWHADAGGAYSGFAQEGTEGETWMRGIQLTGADGVATFRTIYPGWYDGRATHIHLKTYVGGSTGSTYAGGTTAHTGQLFFRDTTTDRIARIAPYSARDVRRVRNAEDGIYGQAGAGSVLKLTRRSASSLRAGMVGRITLGIDAG